MRKILRRIVPLPFDVEAREMQEDGRSPDVTILEPSNNPKKAEDFKYVLRFENLGHDGTWDIPLTELQAKSIAISYPPGASEQ